MGCIYMAPFRRFCFQCLFFFFFFFCFLFFIHFGYGVRARQRRSQWGYSGIGILLNPVQYFNIRNQDISVRRKKKAYQCKYDRFRKGRKKKQSRLAEKELINLVATVVNEKGKENPSLWTRSWRPLGLVQILGGLNIVSKHDVYFPFSFQVPKHMYIDINEKILFLFLLRLLHHIFLYIYCFFFFVPFNGAFCSLTLGLYPWLRSARFNKFQQQKNINHSPSFFC